MERFWRANVFDEIRKKGEVRLGRETLRTVGGLECHTKELGLYPIGSGEPWEDQRIRWTGGDEEFGCSFSSPANLSLMYCRWVHHLLECENLKDP